MINWIKENPLAEFPVFALNICYYYTLLNIQLFQERLSEKMCTRQSRKVIWDMINTLFLTTVAVEPTFVAFLSTRKHMSVASRAILSIFFEEQCT